MSVLIGQLLLAAKDVQDKARKVIFTMGCLTGSSFISSFFDKANLVNSINGKTSISILSFFAVMVSCGSRLAAKCSSQLKPIIESMRVSSMNSGSTNYVY